jgi:polysaccharide export outer membrane protein
MSGHRPSALAVLAGLAALSGCMGDPVPAQSPDFPIASYPSWRINDTAYRFYPGDKFRMDVRTAPELSAELTIAPDGRIALPSVGPVMASGQTVRELQAVLEEIYANELLIEAAAEGSRKKALQALASDPMIRDFREAGEVLDALVVAQQGRLDPFRKAER